MTDQVATPVEEIVVEVPVKITHANVLQDNLIEAVKMVLPFIAKHSTLPVLSHIALYNEHGRLAVAATNLSAYATVYVGAMIDDDFAIAAPGTALRDVAGMLNGMIELVVNPRISKLIMKSSILANKQEGKRVSQQNTMLGIDYAEFPILPNCDTLVAKIPLAELKRVVKRCYVAAANDDTRPILTGIYIEVKDGLVTFTSADGFRLSHDSIKGTDTTDGTYLVPASVLNEFVKTASEPEVEIRAQIKRVHEAEKGGTMVEKDIVSTVAFVCGPIEMGAQVIDGRYPDYTQIIPKDTPVSVTVDREELKSAIKAALVFKKSGDHHGGFLAVKPDDPTTLVVSASDPDLGDTEIKLSAGFVGYSVSMLMDLKYLQDMVNVLTTAQVTIQFQPFVGGKTAKPIKVVENDFVHVIMPMHHDGVHVMLEKSEEELEEPQEAVSEIVERG